MASKGYVIKDNEDCRIQGEQNIKGPPEVFACICLSSLEAFENGVSKISGTLETGSSRRLDRIYSEIILQVSEDAQIERNCARLPQERPL